MICFYLTLIFYDQMDSNSLLKSETNSRSYALIEADPDDFNHIIDLFRQFFPRTRIVECNHQPRHNSLETVSSYQSSSIDSESNTDVFVNNAQIHVKQIDFHLISLVK